jgi:hypothetical protein
MPKLPSLDTLLSLLPDQKSRDVMSMAGGMVLLLGGRKALALGTFAKGARGLELSWREDNDFDGSWRERWDRAISFYEESHKDPTNRKLHVVGIPIIVGGAAGLLFFPAYRPFWFLSASAFTFGWALNLIGHGLYEKNAPALADDPLSFLAGPWWDLQQLRKRKRSGAGRRSRSENEGVRDVVAVNVRPADPAVA